MLIGRQVHTKKAELMLVVPFIVFILLRFIVFQFPLFRNTHDLLTTSPLPGALYKHLHGVAEITITHPFFALFVPL